MHHGAPPGRWFDRRGLRRAGERLGADLLALQEVDRRVVRSAFCDQTKLVASATGLHPVFVPARRLGAVGNYGIALLSRTPARAVEVVRLPPFGSERRVAILASVELDGRPVTVAATHLQNRPSVAVQQLDVVLERLMARPGPHLLLGDLNAGRRLVGPSIEAAGLEALVAPPTFPTRRPVEHIDWIAASGLQLGPPEVPDIWLSDHFPLVTTVAQS
ncbi:MAG: endonuclease/exonuclease/phosphatase family protein [Acidimicrobiales bacterium]